MNSTQLSNLSRRNFLVSSGALVVGSYAYTSGFSPVYANAVRTLSPSVYVAVGSDGIVTVTCHRSEMGQGIKTAVAQVVCEELEADWAKVVVAQAEGDAKYGDQNTDGSRSIKNFFVPLRNAGAAAREMLVQAAADSWGVDVTECEARDHAVHHAASSRSASYGELTDAASLLDVPSSPALKSRDNWKHIGKSRVHVDAKDVATGNATYGADVTLPNMAIAVMVHAPVLGSSPGEVKVPDSVKENSRFIGIETIDATPGPIGFNPVGSVAIIAEDTYTGIKIADELEINWSDSPNQNFDSDAFQQELRNAVENPGRSWHDVGDANGALDEADHKIEAVYETPFLSHAPMEPPSAIANVVGDTVEVLAPVQDPQTTRNTIVGATNFTLENVKVTPTLLGGAFGRKSKPDFVLEAVELSRRLKRPIRVQWRRENDLQYDYFHAPSVQRYEATLGENGMPTAWRQRTAFPSIMSTVAAPNMVEPANWELDMGFTNTPYRCENQSIEAAGLKAGVRIGWLRSVCNIFHAFGANVFVDELAEQAGMDPIDYRLAMWDGMDVVTGAIPSEPGHEFKIERLRNVLRKVRKNADWDRKIGEGRALGVAVHHSFLSYVATVLEVDSSDPNYKVTNAHVVLDCGTYVNSDTCAAQMEGAVVFGLSAAQRAKLTFKNGTIQENNFDGYLIARMPDAPSISVELVDSDQLPAGVGEPGVPPVAPALSNAIYKAGGGRRRSLPLV